MKRTLLATSICLAFAAVAAAQPTVTGWQNNYSYALPGTPNYAAAQGSIVILYGTGMAPAGLLQQGFNPALNKNLGGVSVKFTVGGTTTEGIPYYVSPTAIGVILPSATPTGNGTVTVTYNGQTSPGLPIRVVQSAPGLLTMNGTGSGAAAVYDANYAYVTPTNAANPGQTVIFWGTGIGPDPNDETRLITAPQASTAPFEFFIGNKPATVVYRGRSSYPGLDQMNVVIPAGVSGCAVSAYAKSGNWVSNFVTIPVTASGRVCSDSNGLQTIDNQELLSKGNVSFGTLSLGRSTTRTPDITVQGITIPGSTTTADIATGLFARFTGINFSNYANGNQPSLGGCVVSSFQGNTSVQQPPAISLLDAGTITLRLPNGTTRELTKTQNVYSLTGTSVPTDTLFIPSGGGTFQFTGGGGADVGTFNASLNAANPLVWTNKGSINTVNRSQNLEITWSGGAANSFVFIQGGTASINTTPIVATSFFCTEAVSAGRFTIPSAVLSSLVSGTSSVPGIPTGSLSVSTYSDPVRFTATGLDLGLLYFFSSDGILVNYQ